MLNYISGKMQRLSFFFMLFCAISLFFINFSPVYAFIKPSPKITFSQNISFDDPSPCPDDSKKLCINWMAVYLKQIYTYGIGIIGIIAAIAMVVGGAIWITAGGNASKVGEARTWIGGAFAGLLLGLGSYTIMYAINPDLVRFKPLRVAVPTKEEIIPISGNTSTTIDESTCYQSTRSECESKSEYGFVTNEGSIGNCTPDCPADMTDPGVCTNVCCCGVSANQGCEWKMGCTSDQVSSSWSNCGTNWAGLSQCCCAKDGGTGKITDLKDCIQNNVSVGSFGGYGTPSNSCTTNACCCNNCVGGNSICGHVCTSCHWGCKTGDYQNHAIDWSTSGCQQQCSIANAVNNNCSQAGGGSGAYIICGSGCESVCGNSCDAYRSDHNTHVHIGDNQCKG